MDPTVADMRRFLEAKVATRQTRIDTLHAQACADFDAIEGVTDPALFSRLLGHAEELTRFPVGIVQLEQIEPEFRESIEANGRVVYERP